MAEIKQLKYMYSKDYREVFEDIATLMFCTELGLGKGVNKRINQKAIESDPVLIDGKWYAYQAKYYDESTKLSAHKQDLIMCVKGAASRNVTDLFLYINKDLPDTDSDTGEEAGYIREIERVASQISVNLHWHTLSMMESSLDMPAFAHIKNLYFVKNIKDYYDYVVKLYEKPNIGNTLLGEESLAELYMQPSYYKSYGETGDVEQLLDEFISKGDHGVFWIVGEPGHGKTSMCIKAVADYRSRKRYQQAKGVFWFRLNPQGIPEMVKTKMLALEKVFSWGRIVSNRTNMIEPSQIEGSLVFLDGFDELKSSLEEHGISSNQFYEQVNQLSQEYQMHIVVTSRTRAIDRYGSDTENMLKKGVGKIRCNLSDGGVRENSIRLLAPLTGGEQIAWINELIYHRENNGADTSDLKLYREIFQSLQKNKDITELLEVPILLRMIVQNCFEPSSENRVNLYRDLFDKTMFRQGLESQKERLHSIYQEIAFRIFAFDDDCAEIRMDDFKEITDSDACLYQYYLHTPKSGSGKDRASIYSITFLHRSFYQYFLSEFFYEMLKSVTNCQSGKEFLKYLWARHIDSYVLDNLRLMAKDEYMDCMQILNAIDETDAFFSEYKTPSDSKELIGNYDKANNVFWNAISVCNNLLQNRDSQKELILTERIKKLLSQYACSGILLRCSFLNKTNLCRAILGGADLGGADLSKANLSGADLSGAYLFSADLSGADLSGADLSRADLSRADLSRAGLSRADLSGTNLSGANLCGTNLGGADLSRADLSGANMSGVNISRADLSGAILRRANLCGANLHGANLNNADLSGANLNNALLHGADLHGADLQKANLHGADLHGTDLSETYLCETDLSIAHLQRAVLRGANMCESDLRIAHLNEADMSGTNLSGAYLSGADLQRADLSGAYLSGADLSQADLSGANLHGANLNGADLNGAILAGAKLQDNKS